MTMIRPVVFLCKDKFGRVTIAGWCHDQVQLPKTVDHYRWARLDWQDQIVEWAKSYPISMIMIRHRQRPWIEYSLEAWARKEQRTASLSVAVEERKHDRWKNDNAIG